MTAEQRILDWVERADFDGTGCRHSQATIAKAVGCSREHANRVLTKLAKTGCLEKWQERRPGCKWPCNVYRVPAWNPHKRVGVLGVLAAIRASRKARCHTEENCRPCRAHSPSTTTGAGSQLKDQRCGRVRENTQKEPAAVAAPIEVVRDRLDAGGWEPRGPNDKFRALCPAHDDRHNPALIVSERDDLSVGIYCLASCETPAVVAALGLEMRDLFLPAVPGTPVRRRRAKRTGPPSPKQLDQMLATEGYPVDRVLARYAPDYRCAASPGFWIATCRVCGGELWIHAVLDGEAKPSGPVTLSCENGCVKNSGRAA